MTTPDTLRLFPLAALLVLGTPQPGRTETATAIATLEVTVTGIKSAKGVIRLARSAALPIANGSAHIVLSGLAPGNYALSVFHDANANGKLDTFMGIPKEGYGFSRNPGFKPRAPTFAEAEIDVAGSASAAISLRYIF
jgi:uncharacterized protein (DUF2141 family)